jgi:hypothetical protein
LSFFGSNFTPGGGDDKPPSHAGTIPSGVPAFSDPNGVRSRPSRDASPFAHAVPVIPTANAHAVSNINFFVTGISSDSIFVF